MTHKVLAVLALILFTNCLAADKSYYRGAVVEYHVVKNLTSPRANLMANVNNFGSYIHQAAQNMTDIIVFPESGLMSGDSIFVAVPDPKDRVTPAGNASWDEALQTLSSFAKTNSIYVVVNLHENYTDPTNNKTLKYNTNVVFDRNGTVISRYRKFNLFGAEAAYLNVTKEPEYATFDTDFGVTFGQFICFDILFKEPALGLIEKHKITNFVYPTMWFSELPFLTASQAQWSWAVGHNVNLLAADINDVTRGSGGSGIFRGRFGYWSEAVSTFTNNTANTIIMANIPKVLSTVDASFVERTYSVQTLFAQNETFAMQTQPGLENFTSANIVLPTNSSSVNFVQQVCHGKFCCDFNLNIIYGPNQTDTMYKAVAFSGNRTFASSDPTKHGIEICGVYAYRNSTGLSQIAFGPDLGNIQFTNAKITGNFRSRNAEILPNVLLRPFGFFPATPSPSEVTFTTGDKSEMVWKPTAPQGNVITVAIHSRLFKNSANLAQISIFSVLLPGLLVLLAFKKW